MSGHLSSSSLFNVTLLQNASTQASQQCTPSLSLLAPRETQVTSIMPQSGLFSSAMLQECCRKLLKEGVCKPQTGPQCPRLQLGVALTRVCGAGGSWKSGADTEQPRSREAMAEMCMLLPTLSSLHFGVNRSPSVCTLPLTPVCEAALRTTVKGPRFPGCSHVHLFCLWYLT